MKHNTSNKASHKNIANYTRSKDAYDGNMELTNLKSTSQKISGTASTSRETLSESTKTEKKDA